MTPDALDRFRVAQSRADTGFATALAELKSTGKRSHWIWYVFPQLVGLGVSSDSEEYGIRGPEEAAEYLRDALLRSRLLAVTRAVADRLEHGCSLNRLMGSHIDSLKLVSSLTLFEHAARTLEAESHLDEYEALVELAGRLLDVAQTQGYGRCRFTMDWLGRSPMS